MLHVAKKEKKRKLKDSLNCSTKPSLLMHLGLSWFCVSMNTYDSRGPRWFQIRLQSSLEQGLRRYKLLAAADGLAVCCPVSTLKGTLKLSGGWTRGGSEGRGPAAGPRRAEGWPVQLTTRQGGMREPGRQTPLNPV